MTERKKYGSAYEEAVLTKEHPPLRQRPLDAPPYIAESRLGVWLATRREEFTTIALLGLVLGYCISVYTFGYVVAVKPLKFILNHAWDVAALSVFVLNVLPIPRKFKQQSRRILFVVTAIAAIARYVYPDRFNKGFDPIIWK